MSLGALRLVELVRGARARRASDVHVGAGDAPVLRIDGRLVVLERIGTDDAAISAFLQTTLGAPAVQRLHDVGVDDATVGAEAPGGPFRVHAYRSAAGLRLAIRLLASSIPTLDTLGLPAAAQRFADLHAGLVIVAGPTGSGKTTALAALVARINETSERVILMAEDPVEYRHQARRSVVVHCEIGVHADSYASALHGFMRADPDVVVLGELRDAAAIQAALTAAETGHLVLATLHTGDASQTIQRIVDAFPGPGRQHIRSQLAATLAGAVALRLVPRRCGAGRVLAAEVLVATDAVRALIRDDKAFQLRNAIVTGRNAGMQTLEAHLAELAGRGEIAAQAAADAAVHSSEIRVPVAVAR